MFASNSAVQKPVSAPLANTQLASTEDYSPAYGDDGLCDAQLQGTWRVLGYGYILQLNERSMRLFCENSAGVWEVTSEGVFETTDLMIRKQDTGERRLLSLNVLSAPYWIERIDALPSHYQEGRDWTARAIFNLFAAEMRENYPFFAERDFNWAEREASARKLIADEMSDFELFEAMSSTFKGIGDGHVTLSAHIEGTDYETEEGMPAIFHTLKQDPKHSDKQLGKAAFMLSLGSWVSALKKGILNDILHAEGEVVLGNVAWGWASETIGYINIPEMYFEGFGNNLEEQIVAIHKEFDRICAALQEAEILILDLSLNGGGTDPVALAIASHFADERRVVYSKGPAKHPTLQHDQYLGPWKGKRYTGPIYVVSSDATASAAEIFLLCMQAQPHAKIVGSKSAAMLSDLIEKPLPNGFHFGLSMERYLDSKGICHEGTGIPLAMNFPVFIGPNLKKAHAESILNLVKELSRER